MHRWVTYIVLTLCICLDVSTRSRTRLGSQGARSDVRRCSIVGDLLVGGGDVQCDDVHNGGVHGGSVK